MKQNKKNKAFVLRFIRLFKRREVIDGQAAVIKSVMFTPGL